MDPYRWLAEQGHPDLAEVLATQADVITLNDLAVRIWQEETNPKDFPPLISAELKAAFKAAFADTPDYYQGNSFGDLLTSFQKLTGGSALLNSASLSEGMVHLGQGISLKEIIAVLESLDGNMNAAESPAPGSSPVVLQARKDANISFVEYCRYMRFKLSGRKPPSIKHALKKLFNHYDRDKSGSLDANEVKKLLKTLNLTEVEATTMIAQADTNNDGVLSFEELYKQVKCASGHSNAAWKTLKIWLQLSSGWDVAPKDPQEEAKFHAENPNAKLVTFIRHGQSEGNLAADTCGSAKGWFNPHITPKGIDQAKARGVELKDHKFELIVASPMKRTLETYFHVCGSSGVNVDTPVIGHPLAREQFSDSDDVGDDPAIIKAAWPKINWELFPDKPEVSQKTDEVGLGGNLIPAVVVIPMASN